MATRSQLLGRLGGAELAAAQRALATLDLALHRQRGLLRARWAARCPHYGEAEFRALYDTVVLRGRGVPTPPLPADSALAVLCEGESVRVRVRMRVRVRVRVRVVSVRVRVS